ncbi:hypothetical protein INR49_015468 [Caranx melampygus]|nr:hypothetical protein INR49_015468 [Caranx melampygus]
MRISTVPLLSTFFAELDQHSPRMMELFREKGGVAGKKIRQIMVAISKDHSMEEEEAEAAVAEGRGAKKKTLKTQNLSVLWPTSNKGLWPQPVQFKKEKTGVLCPI